MADTGEKKIFFYLHAESQYNRLKVYPKSSLAFWLLLFVYCVHETPVDWFQCTDPWWGELSTNTIKLFHMYQMMFMYVTDTTG